MKKLSKILIALSLILAFSSCVYVDTIIRPENVIENQVEGLKLIVTRADRSGVYLAFKNYTNETFEIVWKDSILNADKIVQGPYVNNNNLKEEEQNTVLHPNEVFQTVVHRQSDIYYLDPVLYQPGGIKIKDLVYPLDLTLKVKKNGKVQDMNVKIERRLSLEKDSVDAFEVNKTLLEVTDKNLDLREDIEPIKAIYK